MKRTTVKLTDDLDSRLRLLAKRERRSISDIVRDAVAEHLAVLSRRVPPGFLRHRFTSPPDTPSVANGALKREIEEMVREEYEEERRSYLMHRSSTHRSTTANPSTEPAER